MNLEEDEDEDGEALARVWKRGQSFESVCEAFSSEWFGFETVSFLVLTSYECSNQIQM
jgi:hypothetical protein